MYFFFFFFFSHWQEKHFDFRFGYLAHNGLCQDLLMWYKPFQLASEISYYYSRSPMGTYDAFVP